MLFIFENFPFFTAFLLGFLPAMVWMWFWLKEDTHPEPAKMLTLSFMGGALAVLLVLPLQKLVYHYFSSNESLSFFLWAAIEEIAKFTFVYVIALRNKVTDEPVDDIIYLIVSALGFATFENTLFLIDPVLQGSIVDTIIHGNLRFIGASLLHTMSSATIGVFLALSFYKPRKQKLWYAFFGILLSIILHTSFNLFIMSGAPGNIFTVFGIVWTGIVVLLLFFEKVKQITR